MIIKQIYTYNNYRNFNYLIACPITREAAAIDPLAYNLCIEEAEKDEGEEEHEEHEEDRGNETHFKQERKNAFSGIVVETAERTNAFVMV